MRSRNENNLVTVYPFRIVSGSLYEWLDSIRALLPEMELPVITASDAVHGPMHLSSAVYHALKARSRGTNRARELSIEVLRWMTGSRQVSAALDLSAPKGIGSMILVAVIEPLPEMAPPEILPILWERGNIEGLEPVDPAGTEIWAGDKVVDHYGIGEGKDPAKAILEMVAVCDL
jgi:hypothetical protein